MTNQLGINPPTDREISTPCQRCTGDTAHRIVTSTTKSDGHEGIYWSTEYQIIQCMGCKTVSFRSSATCSEEYFFDYNEDQQFSETVSLFPPRLSGFHGLGDDVWVLPEKLRLIYMETSQSMVAPAPVLTGIGIRSILESLCKDQHAAGSNLLNKIDDLVTKNVLTPVRAAVLHQIRTLGNQAAHEVEPHCHEQLALAMNVIDHLLEEVYVIPSKTARIFPAAVVAGLLAPPTV